MTRVNLGVVGKRRKDLVESLVHLRGIAFEEASASADEQGVTGENGTLGAVLEVEADAVLGVAWSVESGYLYAFTDGELRLVGWSGGDLGAVLATDDRQLVVFELINLVAFSSSVDSLTISELPPAWS